jgi:hypothetical protein
MPVVRTKAAAVFDPPEVKCSVVGGYCGVDSAELGRVLAGDLGRSEIVAAAAHAPPRPGPGTHLASGRKSVLRTPLGVLTSVASIHGLLWQSNPLALTRTPRRGT